MNGKIILGFFVVFMGFNLCTYPVYSVPVVLEGVPQFKWAYGCVPTSMADIFGYYDQRGYPNLLNETGSIFLTESVRPDIGLMAELMYTQSYGGTLIGEIVPGATKFARAKGYEITGEIDLNFTWQDLVNQIDTGHPVMGIVDTKGYGYLDHAAPFIGYNVRDDGSKWYAEYNTWQEEEQYYWHEFRPVRSGDIWGVAMAVTFDMVGEIPEPQSVPVPEPITVGLVGMGLIMILAHRWRYR